MFKPSSAAPAAESATPLERAERDALFAPLHAESSLLLAVSGGSDSMALLYLAQGWAQGLRAAPRLVVASINHGLRDEAGGDVEHVRAAAATLGCSFHALRWEGEKPVTGLQNAARQARYALLASCARHNGCSALLTAHTRDDQAETVLMRLLRGSGITGLRGMTAVAAVDGIRLRRPFLDVPRARLQASLRALHVGWRSDPSNDDPRFLRTRLRRLKPQLALEGFSDEALTRLAHKMARADEALDHAVQELCGMVRHTALPRDSYQRAPAEIRLRFLRRVVGAAYPPADSALEALDAALMNEAETRRTLGGVIFSAGSRFLRFTPENDTRVKL